MKSKRSQINLAVVFLLIAILAIFLMIRHNTRPRPLPVTEEDLTDAIRLTASYLVRQCDDSGRFVYRVNLDSTVRVRERYNILRHAGAMTALQRYYSFSGDGSALIVMKRAADFLFKYSLAPVYTHGEMLAFWSNPEVVQRDVPYQAKAGGTGLGLAAVAPLFAMDSTIISREQLRQLGNFLVFLQKDDGSIYSKYVPSEGGFEKNWVSLYYPGEVALGLIRLYEVDPSPRWLSAALKTLKYLAETRAGKTDLPADHWALIATRELLKITADQESRPWKALLEKHAVNVCRSILAEGELNRRKNDPDLAGSFMVDGRTSPTATRLEGLLASLEILKENDPELYLKSINTIEEGTGFLLRSLVREGKFKGGITRALKPLPRDHPGYSKRFNERAREIRIDYVQHALTVFLEYLDG